MEKYTIIKVVGKGTFGQAVLVRSNVDQQQYIIKQISVAQMNEKEKQEALNEVRVLSALNHQYIVKYVTSFMHEGKLCIVMEYAEGGDLYLKIKNAKGQLFKEEMILDWFIQLCLALKHIHDKKILHRDLKTQNIFLSKTGMIKLGDFGIARVLKNTMECAKTLVGTPYYLSPELCQEKPYNNKSDIWSLGCVLYELATLKHAFEGNSMKALVGKILRGIYPPINMRYSKDFRNLIDLMLQKDPKKRPSINSILKLPFLQQRLAQKFGIQIVDKKEVPYEKESPPLIPEKPAPFVEKPTPFLERPSGLPQVQPPKQRDKNEQVLELLAKRREEMMIANAEMAKKEQESKLRYEKLEQQKRAQQQVEQRQAYEKMIAQKAAAAAAQEQRARNVDMFAPKRADIGARNFYPVKEHPQPQPQPQAFLRQPKFKEDELADERKKLYWEARRRAEENRQRAELLNGGGAPVSSRQTPVNPSAYNNIGYNNGGYNYDRERQKAAPKQVIVGDFKNYHHNIQRSVLISNDEKENGLKPPERPRAKSADDKFKLNGHTLRLPNVSQKDSLMYRIESLRMFLEKEMGDNMFLKLYRILKDQTQNDDDDEINAQIVRAVGSENEGFVPLIHQLIFCEERFSGVNVQ